MYRERTGSGRALNEKWKVGAQHARYHGAGIWFHARERFPAALFDTTGYIVFDTKEDSATCPGVHIG